MATITGVLALRSWWRVFAGLRQVEKAIAGWWTVTSQPRSRAWWSAMSAARSWAFHGYSVRRA